MQTKTKMRITPDKALHNADPIVQKLFISQKEFVQERHVDSERRVDPCFIQTYLLSGDKIV